MSRSSRRSSIGQGLFKRIGSYEDLPFYRPTYISARNKFDELKATRKATDDSITVTEKDFETLKAIYQELGVSIADQHWNVLKKELATGNLDWDRFEELLRHFLDIMNRIEVCQSVITDPESFEKKVKEIYKECKGETKGKLSDLYPFLQKQDANRWSVAIQFVDGKKVQMGEPEEVETTLQDCVRPLLYAMALAEHGTGVSKYISCEPSGTHFNEFSLTDGGKAFNPLIDTGALLLCSLVKQPSRLDERFYESQNFLKKMAGNHKIGFNNTAFLSQKSLSDRQRALAYFINERGTFPSGTSIEDVLDFFFQTSALEATVDTIASLAATLANGGINPATGERVLPGEAVTQTLLMMFSCGLYEFSGSWAFHVGLPAKSSYTGALMVVIPGVLGMCTFSPLLDNHFNSVRGLEFCKRMSKTFNFHIFTQIVGTESGEQTLSAKKNQFYSKINDTLFKTENNVTATCNAAAKGDNSRLSFLIKERGVDVNDGDYDSRTPLHLAVANGHLETVKLLVQLGAKWSNKDRMGNNAMDEAIRENKPSIVEFLKSIGAKPSK